MARYTAAIEQAARAHASGSHEAAPKTLKTPKTPRRLDHELQRVSDEIRKEEMEILALEAMLADATREPPAPPPPAPPPTDAADPTETPAAAVPATPRRDAVARTPAPARRGPTPATVRRRLDETARSLGRTPASPRDTPQAASAARLGSATTSGTPLRASTSRAAPAATTPAAAAATPAAAAAAAPAAATPPASTDTPPRRAPRTSPRKAAPATPRAAPDAHAASPSTPRTHAAKRASPAKSAHSTPRTAALSASTSAASPQQRRRTPLSSSVAASPAARSRGVLGQSVAGGAPAASPVRAAPARGPVLLAPGVVPPPSDELERICALLWRVWGDSLRYAAPGCSGAPLASTYTVLQALEQGGAARDGPPPAAPPAPDPSAPLAVGTSMMAHVLLLLFRAPSPHTLPLAQIKAMSDTWWAKQGRAQWLATRDAPASATSAVQHAGWDAADAEQGGDALATRAVYALVAKKVLRIQRAGGAPAVRFAS